MAKVPKPGVAVRGSKTGRPIMAVLDLLGRRWALRILWEIRPGRLTFRSLRERCGNPSPTVLNQRLRELRESKIVDLEEGEGYGLTDLGRELGEHLIPLARWADRWASQSSHKK